MSDRSSARARWARYRQQLIVVDHLGLRLDPSRMDLDEDVLDGYDAPMARALEAMVALEAGAVANPDENRRVGHYWLRAPERAPDTAIRQAVLDTRTRIAAFARDVHEGTIAPPTAPRFTDLLLIGIGGSALGPQLVADALGDPRRDRLAFHSFDNTDPDGMDRTLAALGDRLATTLTVVISKSGGTAETRNGMLTARAAFADAGHDFARHAVAITGDGSALDRVAVDDGWLARFPMWDWVGGRTSETAAVGLVPAALQGLDVHEMLRGAAACDAVTRRGTGDPRAWRRNPAAVLAAAWHHAIHARRTPTMVVLPYRDRLLLLSRYLQQLIMESIGKRHDRQGQEVEEGLAVYGNKGSTDQHAYVQQLRDGRGGFFTLFVESLVDATSGPPVGDGDGDAPAVYAGDHLRGFRLGTRAALDERGRHSLTLTIDRIDAYHLGVLIALHERAVGLYAELVDINAYHQPGVEAGKRAAKDVLTLQAKLLGALAEGPPRTADELAAAVGAADQAETAWQTLEALAANARVTRVSTEDGDPFGARYAGVHA
ncbi:MAG: glucose-6-phosphate isomerase [Acidobacteriota bacterium]